MLFVKKNRRWQNLSRLDFPIKTNTTTTAINSLFINVSSLLQKEQPHVLRLESFLGEKMILQGISDKNLNIYTFDPEALAGSTRFERTISHISLEGRVYQKGWIEKIVKALLTEAEKMQVPLSELLAKKLIARNADHHSNTPAELTVLTFNATALLLWYDRKYKNEIQKLWQLIFGHIDLLERNQPNFEPPPLIEMIQIIMRPPEFNFEHLYSQIQISISLDQNRVINCYEKYPCEPTQIGEWLFNQIKIEFTQHNNTKTFSFLTFLIPYDLPKAIEHIEQISWSDRPVSLSLKIIQELFLNKGSITFGFEQSRTYKYAQDPRRQLSECTRATERLLSTQHEHTWFAGYLLALSLLAQRKDNQLLKSLLKSVVTLLQKNWTTDAFKQNTLEILHRTLVQSHLAINQQIFQDLLICLPDLKTSVKIPIFNQNPLSI